MQWHADVLQLQCRTMPSGRGFCPRQHTVRAGTKRCAPARHPVLARTIGVVHERVGAPHDARVDGRHDEGEGALLELRHPPWTDLVPAIWPRPAGARQAAVNSRHNRHVITTVSGMQRICLKTPNVEIRWAGAKASGCSPLCGRVQAIGVGSRSALVPRDGLEAQQRVDGAAAQPAAPECRQHAHLRRVPAQAERQSHMSCSPGNADRQHADRQSQRVSTT